MPSDYVGKNEEKLYLKRQSGVSLEVLMKIFDENKIKYSIKSQESNEKYFRETIINVKKNLRDLFYNNGIIPNVQLRQFNEAERCIELNALYNFVVPPPISIKLKIDENYVELKQEYLDILDSGKMPTNFPIDRIRIYEAL